MPELPEVETIVRELRPHLVGRTICDASVDWARTIARPEQDVAGFQATIRGHRIQGVSRRGKFVILELDGGWVLLIHLRMSGRLVLWPCGLPQHLRMTLTLAGERRDEVSHLYFFDQRKFGRVWLIEDPQAEIGDLGIEPLSDAFTPAALARMLRGRRGMLKPLLLNQRFIAGLGNIYTDESLFLAGLHPMRAANSLDEGDILRLHDAIQSVLRQAVALHGTTFDGLFVRPDGEHGRQQEGLRVYRQAGLPCVHCGTAIERTVVGGRGTYFCPRCQTPAPVPLTRAAIGESGSCRRAG